MDSRETNNKVCAYDLLNIESARLLLPKRRNDHHTYTWGWTNLDIVVEVKEIWRRPLAMCTELYMHYFFFKYKFGVYTFHFYWPFCFRTILSRGKLWPTKIIHLLYLSLVSLSLLGWVIDYANFAICPNAWYSKVKEKLCYSQIFL